MGRKEAADVVRAFFSGTSCHGLQQIDGGGRIRTVAWMAAVIFTCCLCTYQFVNLGLQIRRYEVTIVPEISDEPIPFPAITMCNLNPYKTSKLYKIPQLKALPLEEKITSELTGGGLKNMTASKARKKRSLSGDGAKGRPKRSAWPCDYHLSPNMRLDTAWTHAGWYGTSVSECGVLCEASLDCPGFAVRKAGPLAGACLLPAGPKGGLSFTPAPPPCDHSYSVYPEADLGEADAGGPPNTTDVSNTRHCEMSCRSSAQCYAISYTAGASVPCKWFTEAAAKSRTVESAPGTDLFVPTIRGCSHTYRAVFLNKENEGVDTLVTLHNAGLEACVAACEGNVSCVFLEYFPHSGTCRLKGEGPEVLSTYNGAVLLYKPDPSSPCAEDWYEPSNVSDCTSTPAFPTSPCAWEKIASFDLSTHGLLALDKGAGTTPFKDCQETCRLNPACKIVQLADDENGDSAGCAHYGAGTGTSDPLWAFNTTLLLRPTQGCEPEVSTPPPPADASACLDVFPHVVKDGYCYRALTDTKVSRAAAKADCETLGGFLAALPTETLRLAVYNHLKNDVSLGDRAWVSLQQVADSSAADVGWFWETPYGRSAPVDMSKWKSNEPSDGTHSAENNAENEAPMGLNSGKYFDASANSGGWPVCMLLFTTISCRTRIPESDGFGVKSPACSPSDSPKLSR